MNTNETAVKVVSYLFGLPQKVCGNCLFLVKDDGKPYYCAIKDLYHLCEETDSACEEWISNAD